MSEQKPTIHELEKILDEHPGKVEIKPDGSIVVNDATPEELQARIAALQAALRECADVIAAIRFSEFGDEPMLMPPLWERAEAAIQSARALIGENSYPSNQKTVG